jgi:hypothetical protein
VVIAVPETHDHRRDEQISRRSSTHEERSLVATTLQTGLPEDVISLSRHLRIVRGLRACAL